MRIESQNGIYLHSGVVINLSIRFRRLGCLSPGF